jgi:hypothetical protein
MNKARGEINLSWLTGRKADTTTAHDSNIRRREKGPENTFPDYE